MSLVERLREKTTKAKEEKAAQEKEQWLQRMEKLWEEHFPIICEKLEKRAEDAESYEQFYARDFFWMQNEQSLHFFVDKIRGEGLVVKVHLEDPDAAEDAQEVEYIEVRWT